MIAALVISAPAMANVGMGMGMGVDDLGQVAKSAASASCGTSLVFDQTVACNAISVALMGY